MSFKYGIVITGSIATGKSTASNILKLLGFRVIDADKIAHKILNQQINKIEELFGKEVIKDNQVDRKALGEIVFNNKEKLKELENLLHPLIREEILSQAKRQEEFKKPYLIELPLFFEKREKYPFSKSVVVYVPREIELERLIKRENLSKDEAKRRIALQMDIEKKKEMADFIIDNSKDLKHLQKECERFKNLALDQFN